MARYQGIVPQEQLSGPTERTQFVARIWRVWMRSEQKSRPNENSILPNAIR